MNIVYDILKSRATEKTRDFLKKLTPTKNEILGVMTADMNDVSKRAIKGEFGDPIKLVREIPTNYYETLMVKGFIIAGIKVDEDTRKTLVKEYVDDVDNWANCDSFVARCKFFNKNPDMWFKFLKEYATGKGEFNIRFGITGMMDYFLTDKYIDKILDILVGIRDEAYYVRMAVAWTVATALSKYYDKTLKILLDKRLDDWTHNKSIQKAIESYRITDEQKAYLRSLKVK